MTYPHAVVIASALIMVGLMVSNAPLGAQAPRSPGYTVYGAGTVANAKLGAWVVELHSGRVKFCTYNFDVPTCTAYSAQ